MSELRRMSRDTPRPTYLLALDGLDGWPEALPFTGTPFSVLLVMDGRDVAEDGFRAWKFFARRSVDQGMAYFSTWGPDCERLHDLMDETLVAWQVSEESPDPPFVMTSSHDDEGLDEAVWFLQVLALNPECQQKGEPCVVVLVGRPDLVDEVLEYCQASSR